MAGMYERVILLWQTTALRPDKAKDIEEEGPEISLRGVPRSQVRDKFEYG